MGLREDIEEVRGYYTDGDCDCYMCQRMRPVLDAAEKWAAIEWFCDIDMGEYAKVLRDDEYGITHQWLFVSQSEIKKILFIAEHYLSAYRASQKESK